jgi:3',5'-cyclic AMP phosphodiesterase CpdA
MARSLLHCSDVHFGPKHHRPQVTAGLLDLIDARRPDLVVVSGDLTERAKPAQFRAAREFVDSVRVPTLVVPGNHDVPMYRLFFMERVLAPFHAYRTYFSADLEPVYRDEEMLVIGVNSAFNWTLKGGRITRRRLHDLEELLAGAPPGLVKVVVVHHPLIPPPGAGAREVLRHARRALNLFSAAGVDLVLSGHMHQAYTGSSGESYLPRGRRPVLVVHSGTTTTSRGRGGERQRNTCNWIRLDGRAIAVSPYAWEPALGRFVEQGRRPDAGVGVAPAVPDGPVAVSSGGPGV